MNLRPESPRRHAGIVHTFLPLLLLLLAASPGLAQVVGGGGIFQDGNGVSGSDAFLFHVLNRVTYGPTEEAWSEIREMGADAFIERQLRPELIDDTAMEQQLQDEVVPRTDQAYDWDYFYYQHTLRAIHSERQLQEIMTQFWENHFDTVVNRGGNDIERHEWTLLEDWENRLFRENALGSFRDLVEISAKSQAMMYFLDNYRNNVAQGNENYARELLELHTLGVDCGYDQTDVEMVARIWTGWNGCYLVRDCSDPGLHTEDIDGDGNIDFVFNPAAHDFFPKDTLGTTFQTEVGETGYEEGERVLDLLVDHPCTARFIGRKLIELFITDDPSEALLDRVATSFRNSNGDIRRTLRTIFRSAEFRDPAYFRNKVKTPFEFTVSAIRAVDGTVQLDASRPEQTLLEVWRQVWAQGMPLFDQSIPTGYAERAPAWINANGFLARWQYTDRLVYQFRNPDGATYVDPMGTTARLNLETTDAVLDHYARMILGEELDPARRLRLREILVADNASGEFDPGDGGQENQLRQMVSHLLGFPEFNKQ